MKIIDAPSTKAWSKQFTCNRCSTCVELEVSDFKRTCHDQRDGSAAVYSCPTCKGDVWVDMSLIPRELHYRLP